MNSLAVSVNVKTMTATIPGKTSGTTARTNAPSRLYPSTMACSSMSFGMLLRKPTKSQTDTGIVIVGYTGTSDRCCPEGVRQPQGATATRTTTWAAPDTRRKLQWPWGLTTAGRVGQARTRLGG